MRRTDKVKRIEEGCHITTNTGKQNLEFCMTHVCYIAICASCGRRFHRHQAGTKTCNNACRQALYRKRSRVKV